MQICRLAGQWVSRSRAENICLVPLNRSLRHPSYASVFCMFYWCLFSTNRGRCSPTAEPPSLKLFPQAGGSQNTSVLSKIWVKSHAVTGAVTVRRTKIESINQHHKLQQLKHMIIINTVYPLPGAQRSFTEVKVTFGLGALFTLSLKGAVCIIVDCKVWFSGWADPTQNFIHCPFQWKHKSIGIKNTWSTESKSTNAYYMFYHFYFAAD